MRVLNSGEIEALLGAADEVFRPVLATAVFSGLRQGELLGLTWRDVDLAAGVIRVRWQWDRTGERVEPKTPGAVRDVIMLPALGRLLREHRARSPFSLDHHPVFASGRGTPLHYRNLSRRGLEAAALRAGLVGEGRPRLRFHDLRHSFASLLISEGLDVVFVSRQLGHADASHHAQGVRAPLRSGAARRSGAGRFGGPVWNNLGTHRWRRTAKRGCCGGRSGGRNPAFLHERRLAAFRASGLGDKRSRVQISAPRSEKAPLRRGFPLSRLSGTLGCADPT